jgi:hypothetical protein
MDMPPRHSSPVSRWTRWLVIALLAFHQVALAGQLCPTDGEIHAIPDAAHCIQAEQGATPPVGAQAVSLSTQILSAPPFSMALKAPPVHARVHARDAAPPGCRIQASILFCNFRQ